MFTILLHSSKTMRGHIGTTIGYQKPQLLEHATDLARYMGTLTPQQIANAMQLSQKMAEKTHDLWHCWSTTPKDQLPAIDAFLGDIYSGLQVRSLTTADREYVNDHLLILSGLYGGLRALDSIAPYRLEMGYKLPDEPYRNLYTFWGATVAELIPDCRTVLNLSAVEYTKAVLPHMPIDTRIVTPKFMTVGTDGKPKFVTVHAKIARGAFAHWVIKNRIETTNGLLDFDELNYRYDDQMSSPKAPVFVAKTFGGLGLSVRLS